MAFSTCDAAREVRSGVHAHVAVRTLADLQYCECGAHRSVTRARTTVWMREAIVELGPFWGGRDVIAYVDDDGRVVSEPTETVRRYNDGTQASGLRREGGVDLPYEHVRVPLGAIARVVRLVQRGVQS
jgi:hypothetical protein